MNETLRCCTLAPYAARVQNTEVEIGGHRIPANVCFTCLILIVCAWFVYFRLQFAWRLVSLSIARSSTLMLISMWSRGPSPLIKCLLIRILCFRFDPERFSAANVNSRPSLAFEPFGFGKRKCLGYKFATTDFTIVIATLFRGLKVDLVPGQVVTPSYGLVTTPIDEIWITVSPRDC